jgi:aldehyde dehydrogenase (NAD+)
MSNTQMFINGAFADTTKKQQAEVINPSDGSILGSGVVATKEDVAPLVAAAKSALKVWSKTTPSERAAALGRLSAAWEARSAELVAAVSQEMGMPVGYSGIFNGFLPMATYGYYAELAGAIELETTQPALGREGTVILRKNPVGVVAAIVPWNFPYVLLANKIAPALAAGCTVIVKPPVENVISARIASEIFEAAGLPAGVINVVAGDVEFSQALVAHPDVDRVAFTGSTATGKAIGAVAGGRLASVNFELGGKSAAIVLDDADLAHTLENLPGLSFMNSGQTCFAQTRVIATPGVYDRVVEGFKGWAEAQVLGDPLADSTTFGPLVHAAAVTRSHKYTTDAVTAGARLVAGGPDAPVPAAGNFVAPTVLADADNSSSLCQNEIFGPVVSIIRAKDEDDAIRLANDVDYGLAGTVWTTSPETALRVARQVEAGSFGVNGYIPDMGAPWGGVKASGTGREQGPQAIDDFTRIDTVYVF